jgi:diacylglycerol kinase (ATP)
MPPITVIRNPMSGRGRSGTKWATVEGQFKAAGATIFLTERSGHATELARRAEGLIVAVGGDGTVSEVAEALIGTDQPMAVIPLGTGNDLARSLGFGTDIEKAAEAALNGEPWRIDAYRWTCGGQQGHGVNIAGCGFDAVVAARINEGYRWIRGTQAYIAAMLESLVRYQPAPVQICVDGESLETTAMLIAVANAQSYGGGMRVAPNAGLDDGLLDVVVVQGLPKLQFLKAFPQVFKGTHVDHPRVRVLRGRYVEIQATPSLPFLVDGELIGASPVKIEVVPKALTVMRPRRS